MEFFENPNVYIVHCKEAKYPSKDTLFRPQYHYPETPFGELSESNTIYGMLRDCMRLMGLDTEQYNTKYWNPLGECFSNTALI